MLLLLGAFHSFLTSYNHFYRVKNFLVYTKWYQRHLNDNRSNRILNNLHAKINSMLLKRTDHLFFYHIWHKNVVFHRTIPISQHLYSYRNESKLIKITPRKPLNNFFNKAKKRTRTKKNLNTEIRFDYYV